ncbi:MAG: hypothetical protein LQ340_007660, partial [Diploschistes diacapsis]
MSPHLEISAFSRHAAITALSYPSSLPSSIPFPFPDRIELCAGPRSLGGSTPATTSLSVVKSHIATLPAPYNAMPVYCMLRPAPPPFQPNCFTVSDAEFQDLKAALLELRAAGADGFVFGILTAEGRIDGERNGEL